MIGLVCSVTDEASGLINHIKKRKFFKYSNIEIISGLINNKKIILVISGVGKVNAAHATTFFILKYRPEIIINFGIAGAFPGSGVSIGDIAIAEREIYADEGIYMTRGFSDMRFIGIPLLKTSNGKALYNEIVFNEGLLASVVNSLRKKGHLVKKGNFITVSTVTATKDRADYLRKRYRPLCESMEGAAVAHVCVMHGVECLEVRGISNFVGPRNRKAWDINAA
ncbi:MAG: futalosine hydrolase, partial [Nitrospirae bacterium]|nr:futalosine hydrolase [Nitrospirota bacterium]